MTVWKILAVVSVFLLTSCAATPDIRLTAAHLEMELQESAYRVSAFAVSGDGRHVASGDVNGDIALWDIRDGKMKWKLNGHRTGGPATNDNWVWSAAFTPDGRTLLTGGGNRDVKLWDVETGTLKRNLAGHAGSAFTGNASVNSLAVSADGRKAVSAGGDGTVRLWDLEKGLLQKSLPAVNSWGGRGMALAADISPDGKYSLSSGGDDTVKFWDNETGEALFSSKVSTDFNEPWLNSVAIAGNGRWAVSGGVNLRYWDLPTGTLLKKVKEQGCGAMHLSLSRDGKKLLTSGCNIISLRDADSGQLLRSYQSGPGNPAARIFSAAVFHPNDKWIVTRGLDAAVRIKDAETDEEIALLVSFADGEWITVTAEGYYNASAQGARYLKVKFAGADYAVDQFYDVFYRPDIVTAKLRGQDIGGLVSITMQDIQKSPPPLVEFTSHTAGGDNRPARVCYRIRSAGGGIGEVRLFHNGKLIESDGYYREMAGSPARQTPPASFNSAAIYEDMRSIKVQGTAGPTVVSRAKGDLVETCTGVEAIPGANEVSLTAFNEGNTVQSDLKTISFHSSLAPAEPHLYILSIGIDRYRDARGALTYAAKDAGDIRDLLRKQAGTIYKPGNIHQELLINEQATRENITRKIDELSRTIKPADSFILFVAGHGVLIQNQYYMLTHDYDGTISAGNTISSNTIIEMSRKVKSLSQLLIFDTCHAGGVDNIVHGLYDARMSVLARKMGLHIYASASDQQTAMDGYKGNGLFTHTLLDGLNNNRQAAKDKDGQVSMAGLGEYSRQQTLNISRQIGHTQTPLIINFGKDAPLYKLP